jgi:hypothetical protein
MAHMRRESRQYRAEAQKAEKGCGDESPEATIQG